MWRTERPFLKFCFAEGFFWFQVGLPAKSGVAGAILLVVPNVMGICCFSPPLDSMGNSCRGVQFCEVQEECFWSCFHWATDALLLLTCWLLAIGFLQIGHVPWRARFSAFISGIGEHLQFPQLRWSDQCWEEAGPTKEQSWCGKQHSCKFAIWSRSRGCHCHKKVGHFAISFEMKNASVFHCVRLQNEQRQTSFAGLSDSHCQVWTCQPQTTTWELPYISLALRATRTLWSSSVNNAKWIQNRRTGRYFFNVG